MIVGIDGVAAALRVPSTTPDRWVYLRRWTDYDTHRERTWSSMAGVCIAWADGGRVACDGLPSFACAAGSAEANAAAIDAWLMSLGAEPVGSGEWPDGCVGLGHRLDRVPFGRDEPQPAEEAGSGR